MKGTSWARTAYGDIAVYSGSLRVGTAIEAVGGYFIYVRAGEHWGQIYKSLEEILNLEVEPK